LQRFAQLLKLARPFQPISLRQVHALPDAAVCLRDRTLKIPSADAELNREITSITFSVDKGRSGLFHHIRYLTQRNVTIRNIDGYIRDVLGSASVFRKKTHNDIESPLAIQYLSYRLPSDGCLHDTVDVVRKHSIARGALTVNTNQKVWLSQHGVD